MPTILSPEEQTRLDAWVGAIRQLARDHNVAHKKAFTLAITSARLKTATSTVDFIVNASAGYCVEAGIPEEQLVAVRTMIFG